MLNLSGQSLKLTLINAENLFLYVDEPQTLNWDQLNEELWQKASASQVNNKPLRKIKELASTLLDIDADIIMITEVGGLESLTHFNNHFLKGLYSPMLKESNSDRGIDMGYLIKKQLPFKPLLLSHKNKSINLQYYEGDTQKYYFSRDVAELRLFQDNQGSPSLVILLAHLKSKLDPDGSDPQGRVRRQAELSALVDIYIDIENELQNKVPIIVCGDFNGNASSLETENEFRELYEKTQLKDALDILERDEKQRTTQIQITKNGNIQYLQLDYIFLSPLLQEKIVSNQTEVFRYKNVWNQESDFPLTIEQRALLPSDHYPYTLVIK